MANGGWYADLDTDNGMHQPVFNTNSSWSPSMSVWFHTKKDCEEFIRDNLISAQWDEDSPEELGGG